MKKYIVSISFFTVSLFFCRSSQAQGLAVNTTGAAADSSAIFDANSTTKGILIPRVTNAQMNAISGPANGLMVYQTDAAGFYYNSGTPSSPLWKSVNGTSATHYTVNVMSVSSNLAINTTITDSNTNYIIYNFNGGGYTPSITITLPAPANFPVGVPIHIASENIGFGGGANFEIITPSGIVNGTDADGYTASSAYFNLGTIGVSAFISNGSNWYQIESR